ncbi:Transmembrane protein 19 [Boothiomyces sp. JEL0838]|nr:Transmembrane protein 19 [Boothiomyces sp. JEL0838]
MLGRITVAFLLSTLLAVHGLKKNLTQSGAAAAFAVGFSIFSLEPAYGILLIVFYLSSSKLTHYNKQLKLKQEEFTASRDHVQVLCNSGWVVVCSFVSFFFGYQYQCSLFCIGVLACCCGDTWASELGSVLSSTPRLITTGKVVPPGTNGGVSVGGLVASVLGGFLIGIAYFVVQHFFTVYKFTIIECILLGSIGGFGGSLIDSLMGATVQATYYDSKLGKIVKKGGTLISGYPLFSNEMVQMINCR